jgi:hypothetical protein
MEARRSINSIHIQQRTRWHLETGAHLHHVLWQRRSFEEAESRTRMKLDVH